MKNSTKILQARIIRIIDIVILSLFIISLFFPYTGGLVPIKFILGAPDPYFSNIDFWFIAMVSFPIILSFVLLIFLIFKPWFENQNLKIAKWIIILIFIFIYMYFLIQTLLDYVDYGSLFAEAPVILTLVLSLFLFLFTLIMTRNNYLIIGNSILAIITVPVVMSCLDTFGPSEIGGYALFLCFALLYGIAVLKLVFRQIRHQPNLTDTPG